MGTKTRWGLGVLAVGLLASGSWLGLVHAPPDREMGDVQRIMYVHVPAVWMMLIAFTLNFSCAVAYMLTSRITLDAWSEAAAEVGVVFCGLGTVLGSIWGRPTWGVWWTWDPRLTTVFVLFVMYSGNLALRRFVENPERRAVLFNVSNILTGAGIPLIWFSVKYFNSIHQVQSSPKTVDSAMVLPLRWNAFAFLAAFLFFLFSRYRIARATQSLQLAVPEAL